LAWPLSFDLSPDDGGDGIRRHDGLAAYPFGVQVATIIGCLKADAMARSSIAFAASQASELLYSAVARATFPPENTKSVKM
jgi:hypothetical protein